MLYGDIRSYVFYFSNFYGLRWVERLYKNVEVFLYFESFIYVCLKVVCVFLIFEFFLILVFFFEDWYRI